jgi:hypothetical protein
MSRANSSPTTWFFSRKDKDTSVCFLCEQEVSTPDYNTRNREHHLQSQHGIRDVGACAGKVVTAVIKAVYCKDEAKDGQAKMIVLRKDPAKMERLYLRYLLELDISFRSVDHPATREVGFFFLFLLVPCQWRWTRGPLPADRCSPGRCARPLRPS